MTDNFLSNNGYYNKGGLNVRPEESRPIPPKGQSVGDAKDKIKDLQEQLKRKEQELQAQRNFTAQEQRKIYCAAYDKTCETGNECKQKKCVFKDRLKYKQALDEIEKIVNVNYYQDSWATLTIKINDILNIINKVKGSK